LELVLVFPTTHLTLSAEKTLEKAGIEHRTIMKPRRISSDCGLAIRVDSRSLDSCQKALTVDGLLPVRFCREVEGEWECVLELGTIKPPDAETR
jgi:hypothetical protein